MVFVFIFGIIRSYSELVTAGWVHFRVAKRHPGQLFTATVTLSYNTNRGAAPPPPSNNTATIVIALAGSESPVEQ